MPPAEASGLERMLRVDDGAVARLLVDSVVDYAIFVLDPRGVVRTWNRGAERLKGYAATDIVGRHFSAFYTEEDRARDLPSSLLARAEQDGAVEHSGWRVRRGGARFWGNVTITALRDDDGDLLGFAKVTRDLTHVREHEEALRRALAREREAASALERLDRARTRFFASVAHDLSTPITVVRSSLQLVRGDPAGESQALDPAVTEELLDDAIRNAEDLEQLRAQLHEFSRLESGKLELRLAPVGLATLARQVAGDAGRAVGAEVVVEVTPQLEVIADELALRRILTNLVNNAARYGQGRPIRILAVPADRSDRVAIGVADEGPGVGHDDHARVFQEFWSGREESRSAGGLGLGLSIVRSYVAEHGGEVWIESDVGHGATFWFSLERASADGQGNSSEVVDRDDA